MASSTPKILNIEFLNQNSMRAYPLADDASEQDITGSFTLPRDLLCDMIFPVDATMDLAASGFYVSNVTVFGVGVNITFSYTDGSTFAVIGTLAVDNTNHTLNRTYYLAGQDDFEG